MLLNLLQANLERLFFLLFILSLHLFVRTGCHPDDRLKRLHHFLVLHLTVPQNHVAELDTTRSLNDHMIARLYLHSGRIKEIHLSGFAEPDTDYFNHISILLHC